MNDYWHTISAMADRETGKTVTPDDVFNLARQGVIRVGANIPEWKYAGNGELEWFYPDGSQVGDFDLFIRPTERNFPVRTRDQLGRASIHEISVYGLLLLCKVVET